MIIETNLKETTGTEIHCKQEKLEKIKIKEVRKNKRKRYNYQNYKTTDK